MHWKLWDTPKEEVRRQLYKNIVLGLLLNKNNIKVILKREIYLYKDFANWGVSGFINSYTQIMQPKIYRDLK